MSDFDEFHPAVLGSDTTDMQAGPMTRIGDAITKGLPAAAISGGLSIVNTALDYAGKDMVNIQEAVTKFDNDTGVYYRDNQENIDLVGFIGTSMVPGTIGMKALKLARGGQAMGAVGKALNLPASNSARYLKQALAEVGESGGVVKNIFSSNRAAHLAWETADQALLSTAFEVAVAGTMHDSPVFDNSSFGDFVWNGMIGGTVGGVLGGAIGGIMAKGVLKNAQKAVEFRKRALDTVLDPDYLGKTTGTGSLELASSMLNLSEDTLNTPFTYRVDGKLIEYPGGLPTSKAFESARVQATRSAEERLAIKMNDLAGGNAVVGQALYRTLIEGVASAKAAGKSGDETVQLLNGYLNHLDSVGPVNLDQIEQIGKVFYVTKSPTSILDSFSPKRIPTGQPGATGKSAYMLVDGTTQEQLKVVNLMDTGHPNLRSAWRAGVDADVIVLPSGQRAINPYSENIKRVAMNPNKVTMHMDVATGTLADEAIPHFADTLVNGKHMTALTSIEAGGKVYPQRGHVPVDTKASALVGSARFAWAAQFGAEGSGRTVKDFIKVTNGTIHSDDIAALSRALELLAGPNGVKATEGLSVIHNGTKMALWEIMDPAGFLRQQKWTALEKSIYDIGAADLRHVAAHLNTSVDYLEEAILHNFVVPNGKELVPDSPTVAAMVPKTIAMTWDFSRTAKIVDPLEAYKQQFGPAFQATRELSVEFQRAIRSRVQDNAFDTTLGAYTDNFLDAPANLAQTTTSSGAGAKLFTSSNANYVKDAELWAQNTGKAVDLTVSKMRDEIIGTLTSDINKVRENPLAAAELGVLTNALRKSEFRYVFDPSNPGSNRLVSTEVAQLAAKNEITIEEALEMLEVTQSGKPRIAHILSIESDDVANFLRNHTAINTKQQGKMSVLYNAAGQTVNRQYDGIVYVPPVNTVKYPYHAFVSTKAKIGTASETTMITAKSAGDLRKLTEQIDSTKYDVHFDQNVANYHKAKGDYEYAMGINESRINSDLFRTGKLSDFHPETKAENVLSDYIEFHGKQTEKLVRTAVQVKNRDFYSELSFLSKNYRAVDESVARGIGSMFKKKIQDPFDDYIKTSLNISKQQEFPLMDKLNEFVDAIGVQAGEAIETAFGEASKGKVGGVTWQQADEIAERYGLGKPFEASNNALEAFKLANATLPPNVVKTAIQKVNTTLANFTIRLDFANSLINMLSTSIMTATEWQSIRGLAKGSPEVEGLIKELTHAKVPGQDLAVPSFFKTIYKASNNFWAPDATIRMERYKRIGAIKDVTTLYRDALNGFAVDPLLSPKTWIDKVNDGAEVMSKYTGSQFSEDFTRFVSADMMAQLTDPLVKSGRMTVKEADAYISVFVNRTQGNYLTSQKPIIFQGTTGAAVSLFQTYAFNVLQQLHRHVEVGDKKTLAMFAGMQSTIFGFNGLPFFDAVNTHLIGTLKGNPEHKDAYNVLPGFNKELGDWMLYGTASAFPFFTGQGPALYTRGDINPRSITVLPTNIADIPAVSASLKLVNSITNFGKNVVQGADITDAMLQGLEHQGISRPLAGFAQLLGGKATTGSGSLISAANDMQTTSWLGALADRTVNYGGVSRVLGARPMNEAVALNNWYRNKAYEALDRERIDNLGRSVKATLYGGAAPTEEQMDDFMSRYAAAGGRIENFNSAINRWQRDANVSVINQTAAKLNTSMGRKMREIMGADLQIPDYRNQPLPTVPAAPGDTGGELP
jgi:hypothetical protein